MLYGIRGFTNGPHGHFLPLVSIFTTKYAVFSTAVAVLIRKK
jgi:hypothetical protein